MTDWSKCDGFLAIVLIASPTKGIDLFFRETIANTTIEVTKEELLRKSLLDVLSKTNLEYFLK